MPEPGHAGNSGSSSEEAATTSGIWRSCEIGRGEEGLDGVCSHVCGVRASASAPLCLYLYVRRFVYTLQEHEPYISPVALLHEHEPNIHI